MTPYTVINAHQARQCHPETCCCSSDYVVVEKRGMIVGSVESEEEGADFIRLLLKEDAGEL